MILKSTTLLIAFLGLSAPVGAATLAPDSDSVLTDEDPLVLTWRDVPYAPMSGCGECAALACPPGEHKVWDVSYESEAPVHECWSGWCDLEHPECMASLDQEQKDANEELIELWSEGVDLERVQALIAANPHIARISVERRSLQMMGCNGTITANLPLTSDQVQHLTQ